uniref:Uncharacterized protein n=1 Tax=Romanomermis culicivorax TaxID=13658 RepID=A0A915IXC5_ROMCU
MKNYQQNSLNKKPPSSGPARIEPTGSAPTITHSGQRSFILRPMPVNVPPVPAPTTIMSSFPGEKSLDWENTMQINRKFII